MHDAVVADPTIELNEHNDHNTIEHRVFELRAKSAAFSVFASLIYTRLQACLTDTRKTSHYEHLPNRAIPRSSRNASKPNRKPKNRSNLIYLAVITGDTPTAYF
jgi:hypothetical protein